VAAVAGLVVAPRNTDRKKNASLAISTVVQSLTLTEQAANSTEERAAHEALRMHTSGGPKHDRHASEAAKTEQKR
jgi:hypothetical protein